MLTHIGAVVYGVIGFLLSFGGMFVSSRGIFANFLF